MGIRISVDEFVCAGLFGCFVGTVAVSADQADAVSLDLAESVASRDDDPEGNPLDLHQLPATTVAEIEAALLDHVTDNWSRYLDDADHPSLLSA